MTKPENLLAEQFAKIFAKSLGAETMWKSHLRAGEEAVKLIGDLPWVRRAALIYDWIRRG